ncbi:hypothetical protein LguiB_024305 [Lonicera macranthoides]
MRTNRLLIAGTLRQVWEGKATTDERNKEGANIDLNNIQKSAALEVVAAASEATPVVESNGDINKISENSSSVLNLVDAPKPVVVPSDEKKVVG